MKGEFYMSKKIIIILIVSACSILALGWLDENNEKSGYKIIYNLTINTQNKDNYSLKIPYPERWNNFLEDIKVIEGNPQISLNETSYGTALFIRGKGNIQISATRDFQNKISDLSMIYRENGRKCAFLFCDKNESENITIDLDFLGNPHNKNEFGYGYYICSPLIQGWQKIEVAEREV